MVVNGIPSSTSEVASGVPQGSVLGPVLFLLFVNDIPAIIQSSTSQVKLFADDTKIYSPINTHEDGKKLQADLLKLVEWSHKWQLPFNQDKCKVIHYGRNNPCFDYYMSDENKPIPVVEEEKDLGVTFDQKMKFSDHVDGICASANRKLGVIKRTFSTMDKTGFMLLYKSIVRPSLEYCSTVWHPYLKKDITKIEKVQRRATRQVKSLQHLSYEDRLKYLNLPSLNYRRHRCDMIQIFKMVHGLDELDPSHFFEIVSESRTRGHKYKIAKKKFNSKLRFCSFSQRVITEWNSLPSYVVESSSLNLFKSNLEKFWCSRRDKFNPDECFACPCSSTAV